jgi:hypothetical protein
MEDGMDQESKVGRTVQALLGIWIVVAVVMLVRLQSVNADGLVPAYDSSESAQNYKRCMEETRTILMTDNLPAR